ncbi:MAG TPA: hypothetical protein DDZ51_17530 [Planctomycetaceae bacterium]|nr:hypothetical protein [Planctomycetaceae bacterium]
MQEIQAAQYRFPYHYIPATDGRLFLSKAWAFAPSYVAALRIVGKELKQVEDSEGSGFKHIDVGCGDGALLYFLVRSFGFDPKKLTGVDFDTAAIAWARLFNPSMMLSSNGVEAIDEAFSSATLIEVLEHIPPPDIPEFLSSVASRLKPGGKLVVTVPSVEKPVPKKHFQHFTFKTLRDLLTDRFDDVKISGFERTDRICRVINWARSNRWFNLDMPCLNQHAVQKLSRLHQSQAKCGRLFATCIKRE